MGFELFCMALIALAVGVAITFSGYRWFLILLPILGFVFGFGLGVDTMQVLFGMGGFATVTGWVVGFFVGAIFAVLSYMFYIVGVALVAGAFGYAVGVGLMGLFGIDPGFLTWIVGVVFGVALAVAVLALNIQKWIIIAITSFGGAGLIVGTFLAMFGVIKPALIGAAAVKLAISNSFLWLVFFLVLGIAGFVAQYYSTRNFTLAPSDPEF
jgi:hypothetical protein